MDFCGVTFDVVNCIWPWLLSIFVVIWSLLSSRLAWWVSGLVGHSIAKRFLLFGLLWFVVISLRLYIFIRLLLKGVMPWTQIHAWNTFLKGVRCYVSNKATTAFMLFLTILPKDKNEDEGSIDDLDIYDIAKKDDLEGFGASDGVAEFITILLNATESDQKYLDGLRLLAQGRVSRSVVAKCINLVLTKLSCWNIKDAQQDILSMGKKIAKRIMEFAIENKEPIIATDALHLLQMVASLERNKKCHVQIPRKMVDAIVFVLNGILMKLYVFCKLHPREPQAPKEAICAENK